MKKFILSYEKWIKIGEGALMAIAGAVLTYFTQHVTASDFGTAGPAVASFFSVFTNYVHKVVTHSPSDEVS